MTHAAHSARRPEIRGWHVLVAIVSFFAVVIGVDTAMMVAAYRTFPGQSVANPYEAGLAFNQTLERREAETRLGWAGKAEALPHSRVRLALTDAAGRPLSGVAVTGALERPATTQGRLEFSFEQTAPGVYEAGTTAADGAWDLTALARDGRGGELEISRRLTWR